MTLQGYLAKKILEYGKFDGAHNISHVKSVLKFAIELAKKIKYKNLEMVATAAVFHDLGLAKNREHHHIFSAKLALKDKFLKNYFTKKQLEEISKACFEHRSSAMIKSKTLLGKIISDADKIGDHTIKSKTIRMWKFRTSSPISKFDSDNEIFEDMHRHLLKKFSTKHGYAKFELPATKKLLANGQKELDYYAHNKDAFRDYFDDLRRRGVLRR